jgi:hypothetical protein
MEDPQKLCIVNKKQITVVDEKPFTSYLSRSLQKEVRREGGVIPPPHQNPVFQLIRRYFN